MFGFKPSKPPGASSHVSGVANGACLNDILDSLERSARFVVIWGPHGCGISHTVLDACERKGLEPVDLHTAREALGIDPGKWTDLAPIVKRRARTAYVLDPFDPSPQGRKGEIDRLHALSKVSRSPILVVTNDEATAEALINTTRGARVIARREDEMRIRKNLFAIEHPGKRPQDVSEAILEAIRRAATASGGNLTHAATQLRWSVASGAPPEPLELPDRARADEGLAVKRARQRLENAPSHVGLRLAPNLSDIETLRWDQTDIRAELLHTINEASLNLDSS